LTIDGLQRNKLLSRGAVIGALSSTSFYTELMPFPLVSLDSLSSGVHSSHEIEFEIDYGPPDQLTRTAIRSVTLDVFSNPGKTEFKDKKNLDAPIGDE
jgi:hypothetical protein